MTSNSCNLQSGAIESGCIQQKNNTKQHPLFLRQAPTEVNIIEIKQGI